MGFNGPSPTEFELHRTAAAYGRLYYQKAVAIPADQSQARWHKWPRRMKLLPSSWLLYRFRIADPLVDGDGRGGVDFVR